MQQARLEKQKRLLLTAKKVSYRKELVKKWRMDNDSRYVNG